MALYQAVAEKGPSYCKGANKLTRMRATNSPACRRVDGIVFTDAHPGNAINLLRGINPSVANENNPPDAPPVADARSVRSRRTASTPTARRTIPPNSRTRYFRAQAERMNRLIDTRARQARAHEAQRLSLPRRRHHRDPARRQPGLGPGASAALFIAQPDIAAVNSTASRRGCCATTAASSEVIKSVYVADPKLSRDNLRFGTGTKIYTLRSFLSANAIRAKHSIDDIDYCSTNNSTVCAVQSITVPVLFAAMGAHYFIRDNERITNCPPARTRTSSPSKAPSTASRRARAAKRRRASIPTRSRTSSTTSRSGSTTATDRATKRKGERRDRRLYLDHRQRPQGSDLPGGDRHALPAAHGRHPQRRAIQAGVHQDQSQPQDPGDHRPGRPRRKTDHAVRVGRDPDLPRRQDRAVHPEGSRRPLPHHRMGDVPDGQYRPDARPGPPLPRQGARTSNTASSATPTRRRGSGR